MKTPQLLLNTPTCGSEDYDPVESSVLETLASLVDSSLLVSRSESSMRQEEDQEPRFTMLETIREYAKRLHAAAGGGYHGYSK